MRIIMKYYLYTICAMLSGCTTSTITGKKKLFGAIPLPFTGSKANTLDLDPDKAQMIEQLAPFVWASIPLIVSGVVFWKLTNGSTGLGVTLVATGIGLAAFAVVMPQIAGYLGLIAILGVLTVCGYMAYKIFKAKKDKKG